MSDQTRCKLYAVTVKIIRVDLIMDSVSVSECGFIHEREDMENVMSLTQVVTFANKQANVRRLSLFLKKR